METPPSLGSAPRSCGQSTASMVLGILSFVLCLGPLAGIPAIILGHVAHSKIGKSRGTLTGSGKALAGLIMGYVNLGLCLVIGPIQAAILVPAVQNALLQGRLTVVMNNGRHIHLGVFEPSVEAPYYALLPKSAPTDPGENNFDNSTDYFAWLVSSGAMNVDFTFFGAPGLPAVQGNDPELFTAANNAWCIVADVDESYPDSAPVLFTRNIAGDSLADLKGPVLLTADEMPFGTRGAVVVLKNGNAFTVRHELRTWEGIMAHPPTDLSNRILRP